MGGRDLDPPETAYVNAAPIRMVGLEQFRDPIEFGRGIRRAGFERVYLHLDLDVIDPADFGSSLMRTPGGPSLDDVEALICQVTEQCQVVGFSVVEFCDRKEGDAGRLCDAIGRFLSIRIAGARADFESSGPGDRDRDRMPAPFG